MSPEDAFRAGYTAGYNKGVQDADVGPMTDSPSEDEAWAAYLTESNQRAYAFEVGMAISAEYGPSPLLSPGPSPGTCRCGDPMAPGVHRLPGSPVEHCG